MIYCQKEIRLKDGRTAVLRAPRPEEAAETVAYLQLSTGETDFLAKYPEEIGYTTESEEAYLRASLEAEHAMMIVCTVDGRIAGNCQIMRRSTKKTQHRAALAIGLLREFWGLGIGTAMLSELIGCAHSMGVRQLELEVVEGNERAMALYRKMGFSVMAEHPDAFLLRDGSLRKAIFMRRLIK